MPLSLIKFVAVFLAIWLPLFSGAALGASVSMQMPRGTCHEMAMDDGSHDLHASAHDQHGCSNCSICHLACGSYLGAQQIQTLETLHVAGLVTPYLFSFHSITSTPLVPPPLV